MVSHKDLTNHMSALFKVKDHIFRINEPDLLKDALNKKFPNEIIKVTDRGNSQCGIYRTIEVTFISDSGLRRAFYAYRGGM